MFYDARDFSFMRRLEAEFDALRAECERVPREAYLQWPLEEAYVGNWMIFPLFSADTRWFQAERCRRNAMLAPRAVEFVRSTPGALLAGFSLLTHGSHVYPHSDKVECSTVRCHLGLRVLGPAGMRTGDSVRYHSEGKCLGFDSDQPHESFNLSGADRVVLLVDVDRSHLERDTPGRDTVERSAVGLGGAESGR
jgi:ornithine lipid ester-linked acyl 2-hydroxylase